MNMTMQNNNKQMMGSKGMDMNSQVHKSQHILSDKQHKQLAEGKYFRSQKINRGNQVIGPDVS